jgi:hypothetical protein
LLVEPVAIIVSLVAPPLAALPFRPLQGRRE